MTDTPTVQVAEGRQHESAVQVGGHVYLKNAKGSLVPAEAVRPQDLLEDEVVRKVLGYAVPLGAEIARFREHTFDDVDGFVGLLEQQYGAKRGGSKGNVSLNSYDGTVRVQVAVADLIVFGPELQVAKGLIDECLTEWTAEGRKETRALIANAFNVDQAGRINRASLLALLRLEFDDPRWVSAMAAIRDSIRVVGSKRYVRISRRDRADGPWRLVPIDVASA